MSLKRNDGDTGPEPFIRQKPQKRRRPVEPEAFANPPRPRSANGGLGCALAGLVILVVIALVALGLFLPPVSLGERLFGTPFAPLDAQSASASANGLTVSVDPAKPGSGFGVRIKEIESQYIRNSSAYTGEDKDWVRAASKALPATRLRNLIVYRVEKRGTAPEAVSIAASIPQRAGTTSGYDLYQYDGSRWVFLPSHPSPDGAALVASVNVLPEAVGLFELDRLVPVIGTVVEIGQQLTPKAAGVASLIHPAGLQPTASGTLQGVLPAGIETGKGYAVVPVIRNFANPAAIDVATVTALLQNRGLRSAHVERLVEFASSKPYQGIAIDYRRLDAEQRDHFTAFIAALAPKLHNANRTLTVVVPFPTQDGSGFNTGAYDWRAIGAVADSLQVILPLDPQTFADKGAVDSALQWAVGEVNRARLQIGLTLLSVQDTNGVFAPIAYADTLAPLGQVEVKPGGVAVAGQPVQASLTGYLAHFAPLDSSGTPSIKYFAPDGTLASTMWLATGAVIRKRLERVTTYNLAGVLALDLLSPGISPDVTNVLSMYKANQPADAQSAALALNWMVNAGGSVVAQSTGVPGTPFVYKPDAANSSVAISAEIVGARQMLGPVVLQVVTATPAPTATPTVLPTATGVPSATAPPTSTPRATKVGVMVTEASRDAAGHVSR